MTRAFVLLLLMLLGGMLPGRAQGPEERYVQIYYIIQQADELVEKGQLPAAVSRYVEAQTALKGLQAGNPGWNEPLIKYRLNYIAAKVAAIKLPEPPPPAATNAAPESVSATNAPAPAEAQGLPPSQVKSMQDEIARLTSQNALLQAKLKEAWAVQPTANDPRALGAAQERIRELEKERDLLKTSLEPGKGEKTPAAGNLAEQEQQLLKEVKEKLAEQTQLVASLQKENDMLKTQLSVLQGAKPQGKPTDLGQDLEVARITVAALQATNISLRTDLLLLERRLAEFGDSVPRSSLREVERQRDDLKRKLSSVEQQLDRRMRRGAVPLDERDRDLEKALARLEVFEAKAVAYTAEELALFNQTDLKVVIPDPGSGKRTVKELPAGAGPLMADAKRASDSGRFGEAEKKYLEVLQQDEKNVYVMGNLAAAQLEQNHLADAEKVLQKALSIEPHDPACLFLMGQLRLSQNKYDEALDSLSLSARLAPEDPRTQFLLGQTLVQKGQRSPAEAAFRKAVQLRPSFGEAHYALGLMYLTQQPTFRELAQWHYQKALASGYPRNQQFEKLLEEKKNAPPATPATTTTQR